MRITDPVTFRIGAQQRATLAAMAETLADHPHTELADLVHAALSGDVPAGALADLVGLSYSGLASWINETDADMTTARAAVLPQVRRVTDAITLGVLTELLPLPGDKVMPALAVLTRMVELRDERDDARKTLAVLRGAHTADGASSTASSETIDSYQTAE